MICSGKQVISLEFRKFWVKYQGIHRSTNEKREGNWEESQKTDKITHFKEKKIYFTIHIYAQHILRD